MCLCFACILLSLYLILKLELSYVSYHHYQQSTILKSQCYFSCLSCYEMHFCCCCCCCCIDYAGVVAVMFCVLNVLCSTTTMKCSASVTVNML